MSNQTFTYKKIVETAADLEREIEKEEAHLMYQEYKSKDEARREATQYVHNKYKDLVAKLYPENSSRRK